MKYAGKGCKRRLQNADLTTWKKRPALLWSSQVPTPYRQCSSKIIHLQFSFLNQSILTKWTATPIPPAIVQKSPLNIDHRSDLNPCVFIPQNECQCNEWSSAQCTVDYSAGCQTGCQDPLNFHIVPDFDSIVTLPDTCTQPITRTPTPTHTHTPNFIGTHRFLK